MKKRIRTLVRSGWHLVTVKMPNSDRWDEFNANATKYKELCNWCSRNVPEDEWVSSNVGTVGIARVNIREIHRRFAFKDEKYASWFTLMTANPIEPELK